MKWCQWLCCLVVVLAALLLALPPPGLVCEAYADCPMSRLGPDEPSVEISLQALFHLLRNFLRRRLASASGYVIVHIAPSVSDDADAAPPTGAKALYPPGGMRIVYAEPNGEVLHQWHQHLQALGITDDDASYEQTAICRQDSQAATLYRASQQFRFDYLPAENPDVLVEHASTNRTRLLSWLRMLSSEVRSLDAAKLESYLESETVRCTTPATLLKQVGVTPSSVEQLHVDVFGLDALEIVEGFMHLEGCRPIMVGFEYRGHHNYEPDVVATLERIVAMFSREGYAVHRTRDDLYVLKA